MQKWCPAEPVCATCRLNSIACMENAGELVPLHDQNWMLSPALSQPRGCGGDDLQRMVASSSVLYLPTCSETWWGTLHVAELRGDEGFPQLYGF